MPDLADKIIELHAALIYAYDHDDDSNEDRDAFIDTLKQYTSTIALAATQAFADMVDVDVDMALLDLTTEQYTKLEASGMLDLYITGKDTTDDN